MPKKRKIKKYVKISPTGPLKDVPKRRKKISNIAKELEKYGG